MSFCIAENDAERKRCRYYHKSSQTARCMYLMFGEYCDCIDAQLNAPKMTFQEEINGAKIPDNTYRTLADYEG